MTRFEKHLKAAHEDMDAEAVILATNRTYEAMLIQGALRGSGEVNRLRSQLREAIAKVQKLETELAAYRLQATAGKPVPQTSRDSGLFKVRSGEVQKRKASA